MNEFKKWQRSDDRQRTMCADVAAKDAWKAALEWALTAAKHYELVSHAISEEIEKELRSLNQQSDNQP